MKDRKEEERRSRHMEIIFVGENLENLYTLFYFNIRFLFHEQIWQCLILSCSKGFVGILRNIIAKFSILS